MWQDMSNNFITAIKFTLPWEAGRDKSGNVRKDGGLNYLDGEVTKWGIYQKANPDLDVPNLTIEDAFKIYKERYYDAYKKYKNKPLDLDAVHVDYAVCVFDTGVNCGVNRCYNWHLAAEKEKDPTKHLLGLRLEHYNKLKVTHKNVYNGWINRLNDLKKFVEILRQEGSVVGSPKPSL